MNALISVSDKTNLIEFAKELTSLGWVIYATEGTANYLESNGIRAKRLSEITGLKESKQIKTLHPAVFERIYSGFFGMVVVNLYEVREIDDIDIGGVSLLRASAKNYRKVLPICKPSQYLEVIERLKDGRIDEDFRLRLAIETFEYIIRYDGKIIEMLRRKSRNI